MGTADFTKQYQSLIFMFLEFASNLLQCFINLYMVTETNCEYVAKLLSSLSLQVSFKKAASIIEMTILSADIANTTVAQVCTLIVENRRRVN